MKKILILFMVVMMGFTGFSQTAHQGHIKVKLESVEHSYYTDVYFNDNASDMLDPGYDAAPFQVLPFSLYSYLVDDTGYEGLRLAVQSLHSEAINGSLISLDVNAYKDQLVQFKVAQTDLTSATKVYIVDVVNNIKSELPYTFTPSEDLKGPGRFYLRFEGDVIFDTPPPPVVYEQMNVSITYKRGSVVIKGSVPAGTEYKFYYGDVLIQKRTLPSKKRQTIGVSGLMAGIYTVKLSYDNKRAEQNIRIR